MTLRLNLTLVMAAILLPGVSFAQGTGVLRGCVVDPMRAAIEGAHVVASGTDDGVNVRADSDGSGLFTIQLEPGRYSVTVESPGFADATRTVTVIAGGVAVEDFMLQLAGFTQAVEVAGKTLAERPINPSTRTSTPLRDTPQSVTVVTGGLIRDQLMSSVADTINYVPGITSHQGENNRDQIIIRGNSSSADFYVNGVRDDVQYYRDLYNVARVEALKGPNGMMFGRGGGGGVVNRVTKQAGFIRTGEAMLQAGSFGNRRLTGDVNEPVSGTVAFRINGVVEDSDSFRKGVALQRYGIAPTVTVMRSDRTAFTFDYEHFHDERVADRGITSYRGQPADVARSTYFGNAATSPVRADVDVAGATVEHHVSGFTIRNRTVVGNYDRAYQNYVPGVVTQDGSGVSLSAYNNATARLNAFNQTDVTRLVTTRGMRHTILFGWEAGRQRSNNFRNTGFFGNTAASVVVPLSNPVTDVAMTYRQSATDADNRVRTHLAALYAQDQVELSRFVQVIGGARVDRFDLQYHNNRNGDTLGRVDHLVSPRAGIVVKPVEAASIYGSYALSYLPGSGDQFASLTAITQQMKPERFTNYEAGVKWDVRADLSLTTALYRLDRTNTRSTDPSDPTRIIQTGSQRTNGYEVGINGHVTPLWTVAGGYARQNAYVTSATAAAREGAQVGQVPHHTFSLWNNYQVLPRVGAALGVIRRSDMFAAIDNTVTLPAYTRADAALFISLAERTRLQVNIENLFDRAYFVNADSNTNISPGSPRTLRVALSAGF